MPSLATLDGELLRIDPNGHYQVVEQLRDAHGVMFLCPKCYQANGGAVGTHSVRAWFARKGVPAGLLPAPRWTATGTTVADLTLTPSIHLRGKSCGWHGHVTSGSAL